MKKSFIRKISIMFRIDNEESLSEVLSKPNEVQILHYKRKYDLAFNFFPNLKELTVFEWNYKEFNLSSNSIEELYISNNPSIKILKLNCPRLVSLYCNNCSISFVELKCDNLKTMECDGNNLGELMTDLSKLSLLKCSNNSIKNLVCLNPNLTTLIISGNPIERLVILGNISKVLKGKKKVIYNKRNVLKSLKRPDYSAVVE